MRVKFLFLSIPPILFLILFGFINCSGPTSHDPTPNQMRGGTDAGNPYTYKSIAALPKIFLPSDFPALSLNHRVLLVGPDKQYRNCQSAIDVAEPGDEVVIDAKFICSPIHLKNKGSSDQYVVIRSANLAQLSPQGTRINRTDSKNLAVIETAIDDYAVYAEEWSHHFYLAGLEIRVNSSFSQIHRGLVSVGPWYLTPVEQIPHSIVFSRSWIHAAPLQEVSSGVLLNGSAISIVALTTVPSRIFKRAC